jgi:lipoate-protein ligase A
VAREEDICVSTSVIEAYRKISEALTAGLRALGAPAAIEPGRRGPRRGAGQPCFSSAVRYEVSVRGRKILGSAQRRRDGVLLQHGSLPLTDDYLRIEEVLPSGSGRGSSLAETTTCLNATLNRRVSFQEVADGISAGFTAIFGVSLKPGEISADEITLTQSLVEKSLFRSRTGES